MADDGTDTPVTEPHLPDPQLPDGVRAALARRETWAGPPPGLHDDVLAALREALSNVARHAGAGSVDVEVAVHPATRRLDLRVCDDGRGIGPGPHRGSGVANMGDRAHRWGGWCVVQTRAGGGTEVHWTVPLPGQDGVAP